MEDCWDAVQVFQFCEWSRVGLSGLKEARVYVTHIEAVEIECVCRALEVPFTGELLAQVRYMESIARPLRNAK